MCGINGMIGGDVEAIKRMNAAVSHRGPDGKAVWDSGTIIFGQTLLSVMDVPDNARQPVVSPDRRYALVYNGEIYNYRKLREDLKRKGISFTTDTDTEVLFKGLRHEGPPFLNRLNGMFAVAWYDEEKRTLTLARDASGMKPLYLYQDEKTFVFSSEIRALLESGVTPRLNQETLAPFFILGYVPGKQTLFSGIKKLDPGAVVTFDTNTLQENKRMYITHDIPQREFNNHTEMTRSLLCEAVQAHLIARKPVGLYLSGGLDSSILLYEISEKASNPARTYTTRFDVNDQMYNEDADIAKKFSVMRRTSHHELLITESMYCEAIEPTLRALEEPRFNYSTPAQWLLAREAQKENTVMLSGEGGDELFLGYPRYLVSRDMSEKYARLPVSMVDFLYSAKFIVDGVFRPFEHMALSNPLNRWALLNHADSMRSGIPLTGKPFSLSKVTRFLNGSEHPLFSSLSEDTANAIADLDTLLWLSDESFLRTDKINMQFSLEGRFPFTDVFLRHHVRKLPSIEKLKGGITKALLRNAYRGSLPDYIIDKSKTGWNAPIPWWIRGNLGNVVREVLSPGYYEPTKELFDFSMLHKTLARASEVPHSTSKVLLKGVMPAFFFQIWARAFDVRV